MTVIQLPTQIESPVINEGVKFFRISSLGFTKVSSDYRDKVHVVFGDSPDIICGVHKTYPNKMREFKEFLDTPHPKLLCRTCQKILYWKLKKKRQEIADNLLYQIKIRRQTSGNE